MVGSASELPGVVGRSGDVEGRKEELLGLVVDAEPGTLSGVLAVRLCDSEFSRSGVTC